MSETLARAEAAPKYRNYVAEGDIVRMEDGTYAIVTGWDIVMGGHVKEVYLCPVNSLWRRFVGSLTGRWTRSEGEIDKLVKIGSIYENEDV